MAIVSVNAPDYQRSFDFGERGFGDRLVPLPTFVSTSLSELDAKSTFPKLPSATPLSAKEVSEQLKSLVVVITPARRTWFSHNELPSNGFGAGVRSKPARRGTYLLLPGTSSMNPC